MKILILLAYYNRPLLVQNALQSILDADEYYQNWHLAFGDDGSLYEGKPVVVSMLSDYLGQVSFYRSNLTFEEKMIQGTGVADMANSAMIHSDADIGVILCDDDKLRPTYLRDLADFYQRQTDVSYAYSYVTPYDPFTQEELDPSLVYKINRWHKPISPARKVDSSQVSWRIGPCIDQDAWFENVPGFRDVDRAFFDKLYSVFGDCQPTGLYGQWKGVHQYQLDQKRSEEDWWEYNQMTRELGRVEF